MTLHQLLTNDGHLHGQVLLLHLEPLLIVEDGRVVQIEIPALIVVEFLVFRFASVDVARLRGATVISGGDSALRAFACAQVRSRVLPVR